MVGCSSQPAPRDRTIRPLPEPRTGWRGVVYQGGFTYIYLARGKQPIRCSDNRPNIQSLIRRTVDQEYMVDVDLNPGRLLREDNGHFKVFLGNRQTVYLFIGEYSL
jgi:hypothetical protein